MLLSLSRSSSFLICDVTTSATDRNTDVEVTSEIRPLPGWLFAAAPEIDLKIRKASSILSMDEALFLKVELSDSAVVDVCWLNSAAISNLQSAS